MYKCINICVYVFICVYVYLFKYNKNVLNAFFLVWLK